LTVVSPLNGVKPTDVTAHVQQYSCRHGQHQPARQHRCGGARPENHGVWAIWCWSIRKVFPSADATALASGASDILATARVVATLEEAVADCKLVIGASARSRTIPWSMMDSRQAGELVRTGVGTSSGGAGVWSGRPGSDQ
jgi:hypothetical protein